MIPIARLSLVGSLLVACSSGPGADPSAIPVAGAERSGTTVKDPPATPARGADDSAITVGDDAGGPPTVIQEGTVIDFNSGAPVAGATVSVGGQLATSDALGHYAIPVETGAPFPTEVSASGYVDVNDQWAVYAQAATRSPTVLVSTASEAAIAEQLDAYDPTLGALMIEVLAIGDCHDVTGAQIQPSQASARIAYFAGNLPASGSNGVTSASAPWAIVYNLPPGAPVDVTVTSPTCATADRPVNLATVTYYEVVPILAGQLGLERVFLGRLPPESMPGE
jgi:hypothetical protein